MLMQWTIEKYTKLSYDYRIWEVDILGFSLVNMPLVNDD